MHKVELSDSTEIFPLRGTEFRHEAVRAWETKLTPLPIDSVSLAPPL
jgi:hypothetical protein